MEQPAVHNVFFRHAYLVLDLESRIETGKHLVYAHYNNGDIRLLQHLGAGKKNVVLVAPAEELLEAEDLFPGTRFIADDLRGALREGPRRFVTARLDARGPLSDDFVDKVRNVVAHGMAQDGLLVVNFTVGDGEDGDIITRFSDKRGFLAFASTAAPPGAMDGLTRAVALADHIARSFNGAPTRWTPMRLDYYPHTPGSSVWCFEASGLVTRGMPDGAVDLGDGDTATHVDTNLITTNELGLQVAALRTAARFEHTRLLPSLPILFNLPKETIDQWLANPPPELSPPPPSVRSSAPSSSRTFPTGSPRSRLFRS